MHNSQLLKVVTSTGSIACFLINAFTSMHLFLWVGLFFYLICLLLYFESFLYKLIISHKVSAELLVVSVMIIALINNQIMSGAVVAWFIGLGLYISFTIVRKNRERIEALIKESRRTARVLRGERVREISIREIKRGDIIIVPKGDMIPIDGIIIEGESLIDESHITGEPFAVLKKPGEEVISGSINISAPISVRASKNGDESYLSIITSEIERALKRKAKVQEIADAFAQIFISSIVFYAVVIYFITRNLNITATILAIACPCAWVLATPTAFAAAIGRLAKESILAKGGAPIEKLSKVSTIVLDKTGTITFAKPEIKKIILLEGRENDFLRIVASIESRFDHPIANAIVDYARRRGIKNFKVVKNAEDIPGSGVRAFIDGKEVIIGGSMLMKNLGIELPAIDYRGRGIWVVINGKPRGLIVLQDIIKTHMKGLASKIKSFGVKRVILATGDHEEKEARRVAEIIGADEYYYNYKPEDKARLIKKLSSEGIVAMVGDGINDSLALATADIGIAVNAYKNLNLVLKSSDIIILGSDAVGVLRLLDMSEKVRRVIKIDYIWAAIFNTVGIALATLCMLNPIIAALLHHISSVFVVANAARIYMK